ncbi:MAG: M12 family metallopeptidase [Pseudonocardiaceae bacterium]
MEQPNKNRDEMSPEEINVGTEWRAGYYSGPGIGTMAVQFAVEDGLGVVEGDIVLGTLEELTASAGAAAASDSEIIATGVGIAGDQFRWPNGVIPYEIASDLPNKQRVTDAIAHWHDKTGIRFVARTASNAGQYPNYVEIVPGDGCRAEVGMRGNGRQRVWLGDGCSTGNTIHEFGHTVGLWHEQSREDREQFVEIKWENIESDKLGNFVQHISDGDDYGPYDYGSIMHYPGNAFSKNGQPTIVPKKPGVTIGQREGLSFGDRLAVAEMYEKYATKGFSGVFRSMSGGYGLWANTTWDSFRAKWQEWSGQGLRLVDLNVHRVNGVDRYSGVFLPGSGGHGLWANATWDSFRAKWQEWSGQGLRLVDLNVHRVNGVDRYSGAFLAGTGGYALWANVTWESFKAKWEQLAEQGLRLVDFEFVNAGDQALDADAAVFSGGALQGGAMETEQQPFGVVLDLPEGVTTDEPGGGDGAGAEVEDSGGVVLVDVIPSGAGDMAVGDVYLPGSAPTAGAAADTGTGGIGGAVLSGVGEAGMEDDGHGALVGIE